MSNRHPDTAGRVLLALDSSVRCGAVLQAAARLAAEQHAELVALFVEDLDLVRLASLPFAREVDRGSALERPLDSLRMERSLRRQAEQVRAALEQSGRSLSLNVSLRVVRGRFLASALSEAAEHDLLVLARLGGTVLARPTRPTSRRAWPAPLWAAVAEERAPVAVIYDGSAAAEGALTVAGHLARSDGRPILVVYPAGGDAADGIRAHTAAALKRFTDRVHYATVPGDDIDELARLANEADCEMLVLNRERREEDPATFRRLVETIDCSVVLVP